MNSNDWSVDPNKLAALQRTLEGKVAVVDMPRASNLLAADQGELTYKVAFNTDEDNWCVITGQLQVELTLCCQRCLQSFVQLVQGDFVVSPVASDNEAKQMPSIYEPVITQDGKIDILELIEDELILALPQVPMHEPTECSVIIENVVENEPQELNQPFQILQQLKVKNKGQMAEDN